MRLIVAGIIGGIVMFMWGAVWHMALPFSEAGMKVPPQQQVVLDAIAPTTSGEGIYMYPSISPEKMSDKAAMQAFAEETRGKPYALVVYQPGGNPINQSMVPNLVKQLVTCILAALVLAWVLSLTAWGFGRRVMVAGAMAVFAWIAISLPHWNWYMFPMSFTASALGEQLVGWLLAGAAIAWWLGRGERAK
ncbi:putative oligopeptide transporter (OPT) family protein [Lysobacter niastensis]|uniref:Oligopeptide transporter (OPT) family protein n=1 Tax=Lysobacter niastensis TaxID=380629 RepID=A0ABU1W6W9_9GAMM|nr:hypothetical protein [Lysobacter niastensis]MDR7133321.1 putative oligopeptide transporter (OPT) family protein [Lysobacter niastensis]